MRQALAPEPFINDLQDVMEELTMHFKSNDKHVTYSPVLSASTTKRTFKTSFDGNDGEGSAEYIKPTDSNDVGTFRVIHTKTGKSKSGQAFKPKVWTFKRMRRTGFSPSFASTVTNLEFPSLFEQIKLMYLARAKAEYNLDAHRFAQETPFHVVGFRRTVTASDRATKLLVLDFFERNEKVKVRVRKNIQGKNEYFKYEFVKSAFDAHFCLEYITLIMRAGPGQPPSKPVSVKFEKMLGDTSHLGNNVEEEVEDHLNVDEFEIPAEKYLVRV